MNEHTLELFLFRHGESARNNERHLIGGRTNHTPLSQRGLEQAVLLGRLLQGTSFDLVYTSTAPRSIETARITCAEMGYTGSIIPRDELIEISQGDWDGKPRKEVYTPEVLAQINSPPYGTFRPPGGESHLDVEHRMMAFVEEIPTKRDNLVVGVFTHGVTIKCLFRGLMESNPERTYKIVIYNASITRFKHTKRGWHLLTLNDSAHLEGHGKLYDRYAGGED